MAKQVHLIEEEEPFEEEDPPQNIIPGHVEVAAMESTGELSELLLELVGNTTKVLTLLLETDEVEFAMNAQRLQMFFDLVNQMPTKPAHRTEPTRPIGFQPPGKSKTLPRKRRSTKPKKTE